MFENKKDIFKTVYQLARNKRIAYEKKQDKKETGSFKECKELQRDKEAKVLYDYLDSLSLENIKVIQTIMFLGRDMDYNKSDSPEEIYKKQREDMNKTGWDTKEIEICELEGKTELDKYLKNGFKILNINL